MTSSDDNTYLHPADDERQERFRAAQERTLEFYRSGVIETRIDQAIEEGERSFNEAMGDSPEWKALVSTPEGQQRLREAGRAMRERIQEAIMAQRRTEDRHGRD